MIYSPLIQRIKKIKSQRNPYEIRIYAVITTKGDVMPIFVLDRKQQLNGDHEVHNKTTRCSHMPIVISQIDLGLHPTSQEAVNEAKKEYPMWMINGCKYCCPDSHEND